MLQLTAVRKYDMYMSCTIQFIRKGQSKNQAGAAKTLSEEHQQNDVNSRSQLCRTTYRLVKQQEAVNTTGKQDTPQRFKSGQNGAHAGSAVS